MTEILSIFSTPFEFEFMRRGLLIATLVGIVCALLSCYLILKGWSLMGDAVSHAVLPGIVIAYMAGLPLALGAFLAGLGCATATGYLKDNSRVKEDAIMAIVFTGMFALGLVMFVKVVTEQHLNHILFGNLLGVQWQDAIETAIIAVPTILFVIIKWRDLLLYCFDPAHARAVGVSTTFLHYALLSLLALTIVASLKAVGIILVIAMLIAPGAIAFVLTKRFIHMLVIATVAAVTACIAGTIISFHMDTATGPTIVVFQAALLALAILYTSFDRNKLRPGIA